MLGFFLSLFLMIPLSGYAALEYSKIEHLGYMSEDGVEVTVSTVAQLFAGPVEFDGLIDEIYTFFNELVTSRINEKN